MPRSFRTAALAMLLATGAVHAQTSAPAPVAQVSEGKVSGLRRDGVDAFLGMPFAAPPTGANRWRAPQPAAAWKGTRAADRFGPSCPQNIAPGGFGPWTQEYVPSGEVSEDCLSINVWKPAGNARKLPVLVWIHGGGFTSGSASVPVYDGAALARQGIVVVSLNYRLGLLGGLASPELRNAGGGYFGLQDQIAGLRWIRKNVAAFGGDPQKVTIAGQSAGAISVHYLMLSPQARGLFSQAIPQSGVGLGTGFDLELPSRADAEARAAAFLDALGVRSLAEARQLPLAQVTAAYLKVAAASGRGFKLGPYADGSVLPLDPVAAFTAGRYNDTPVLIGLTSDEGSGLNPSYRLRDPAKYEVLLRQRYGARADELAKLYAGAEPLPALLRDAGLAAMLRWSHERARTSRHPLYGYVWTHVEPGPESARYGAFHTSEVPYVFGTLDKAPSRPFTAEDRRIAQVMQGYWVNFIKTGTPNGPGLEQWPAFGAKPEFMELGNRFAPYPPLDPKAEALFEEHAKAGGSLLVM